MTQISKNILKYLDKNPRKSAKSADKKALISNQKGITLIEMIVFIIVAAVAIPAIVYPVLSLLKEGTRPEKAITANFLGQQKLEEITKNAYPGITIETQDYAVVTGFDGYEWSWNIGYVNSDLSGSVTETKYKMITVIVRDPVGTEYEYYTMATKRKNDPPVEIIP